MTKQRRILSAVLALAMTGMSFSGVVNADSVNENNSDVIEKWTNMTDEEAEKEWQSYQFIFDIHQKVKEAFNEKLTGYVYSFGIYTNPEDPSKSIEYIEVGDEKTKEEVINILTEAGISESYYEVNISQAGPPQILVATASNTDTQNKADAKESEALNNKTTEESNNKVPENMDEYQKKNDELVEKWMNMTDEEAEKEWQSYQFIFDIHQKVKEAFNEKLTGYVYSFGIYTNPDDPSKSIEYIEVGDEKTKEEVINILTEAGISESYYEVNISQAGPPQILVATASNTDTQNIIYGDLNDDGTADLTDLTLLSLYLMKSADFTDSQIEAADIDGSGEVDIADLAYFKQYVCKDAAVASKIRIGIKNNDDHGNIQDGGDYSKVEHEQGEEGFSGAREATPEQIAESLNQPEKD